MGIIHQGSEEGQNESFALLLLLPPYVLLNGEMGWDWACCFCSYYTIPPPMHFDENDLYLME